MQNSAVDTVTVVPYISLISGTAPDPPAKARRVFALRAGEKEIRTQSRGDGEEKLRCHPRRARDIAREVKGTQAGTQVPLSKKFVITGLVPVIHFPETKQNLVGLWKMDGRHKKPAMTDFILERRTSETSAALRLCVNIFRRNNDGESDMKLCTGPP